MATLPRTEFGNEQFKVSFCPRKTLLYVLLEMECNGMEFILIFIIKGRRKNVVCVCIMDVLSEVQHAVFSSWLMSLFNLF